MKITNKKQREAKDDLIPCPNCLSKPAYVDPTPDLPPHLREYVKSKGGVSDHRICYQCGAPFLVRNGVGVVLRPSEFKKHIGYEFAKGFGLKIVEKMWG